MNTKKAVVLCAVPILALIVLLLPLGGWEISLALLLLLAAFVKMRSNNKPKPIASNTVNGTITGLGYDGGDLIVYLDDDDLGYRIPEDPYPTLQPGDTVFLERRTGEPDCWRIEPSSERDEHHSATGSWTTTSLLPVARS